MLDLIFVIYNLYAKTMPHSSSSRVPKFESKKATQKEYQKAKNTHFGSRFNQKKTLSERKTKVWKNYIAVKKTETENRRKKGE